MADPALVFQTGAEAAADRNRESNLRALRRTQPRLVERIGAVAAEVEWVFGRDSTLTALQGEQWWSGCSVQERAGGKLLEKLELRGTVGCFLCPTHSAQIRAALDRLKRDRKSAV